MRYLLVFFFISSPMFSQLLINSSESENPFADYDSVKSVSHVFENSSERKISGSFTLHQNYPNPFNPTTTISYEINETSYIELRIYDALGRLVTMADEGIKIPGSYKVIFDTQGLASGIYFYILISGEYKARNKMLLLK